MEEDPHCQAVWGYLGYRTNWIAIVYEFQGIQTYLSLHKSDSNTTVRRHRPTCLHSPGFRHEDSLPQSPAWFGAQEALTQGDKTSNLQYPIWVQMMQLNAVKEERVMYACDVRVCLPVHLVPPPRKASPTDTDPLGPSSRWKHTAPVTPHLPMMLSRHPFASLLAGWQGRGDNHSSQQQFTLCTPCAESEAFTPGQHL